MNSPSAAIIMTIIWKPGSTFTYKKSRKHVKSIKNVIISKLLVISKIKDSFSFFGTHS